MQYSHKQVESKWQKKWLQTKIYSPDLTKVKKPFYNLMMFPYPSAEGLHAGNMFAFTGSDIYGRLKRMQGHDVFEPIGLDGFGIHAENYALKIDRTPVDNSKITEKNYYRQLQEIGAGFDWDHNLETYNPNYYHWTQWLFRETFKAGLAYRKKAEVNFCPKDKTVLSDEQVMTPKQAEKDPIDKDGNPVPNREGLLVCERCGTLVEKRELEVWFFRITDYAERLLNNLPKIDWSERVKIAQKAWIGKKDGINIIYKIADLDKTITVFTTTPVNFGATFLVVAPEYAKKNLFDLIPTSYQRNVFKYIKDSLSTSKANRKENTEKTGVFTGLYVINHVNNKKIPVWVADFVLMDFGTGAVQGCPAHDERDFEFATKFGLPIIRVVAGSNGEKGPVKTVEQVTAGEKAGVMVNSDFLNGLEFTKAMKKTMDYFEEKGWGKRVKTYHLRDWGIGRQRYWGCPIPMIHCQRCAQKGEGWIASNKKKLLHQDQNDWAWQGWWPEENLPVNLPVIKDYKPEGNGRGPLANHPEFYEVKCPHCGADAKRETDVCDTFLDSSWYFLRYPSTDFTKIPFDPKTTKKWLPVSQYFGGAEHSVLHLMYSRFMTMMLSDLKLLDFDEPFPKFFAHGLVIKDGAKMSKSRGNVVNPDDYIKKFGADVLRTYLMFMGPMDSTMDFRDTGIEGIERFTKRIWSLYSSSQKKVEKNLLQTKTHQTIQKVTKDIEIFHYNTAISAIMEFVNFLHTNGTSKEALTALCQLIAPFAPHIAEELWVEVLGNKYSVHNSKWPVFDVKLTTEKYLVIVIQINGKTRSQVKLSSEEGNAKDKVEKLALTDKRTSKWLKGHKIVKTIFVPGKIINFVTIPNSV